MKLSTFFSPLLQQQTRMKTIKMYAKIKIMWSNEDIKNEQKFEVLAEKAELPDTVGKHWSRNKSRTLNSRQRWQKQELFNNHQHKMTANEALLRKKDLTFYTCIWMWGFGANTFFLMLGQWHISNIQSRPVKLEDQDLSSQMLELLCLLEGVALTILRTMLLTKTAVGI